MSYRLRPRTTHISVALELLRNQKCAWTAIIPQMLALRWCLPLPLALRPLLGAQTPSKFPAVGFYPWLSNALSCRAACLVTLATSCRPTRRGA
eukprot:5459571-Pyramimonas_sp.AAC.1